MSALVPRLTKYIPYPPTIRQQAALAVYDRELLYGGAAGGGKSDWLLMAALQFADCADYSAVIFRRTFAQLSANDGLLPLCQEWLAPTDAQGAESLNGYPTRWDFPSGAVLRFSHLQTLKDRFNHQGPRYDFCGFDELTQFLRLQYTYLFSRQRRADGSTIPLRMRAASNPGGEGHDWVQERFEIPKYPLRNLYTAPKSGRLFLPAKLDDNPHLDQEAYIRSLDELDPVTRAQLLQGDWSVRDLSGMIRREWFDVVETAPERAQRVRYWDRAATVPKEGQDPDWTVGTLYCKASDGTFYVEHVDRFRDGPAETRNRIRQRAQLDGTGIPVLLEIEPGSSGKSEFDTTRRTLPQFTVQPDRPTGKKAERAGPAASAAQGGQVKLVRGDWCSAWLDEMESFPIGAHDDQVDSWSGAHGYVNRGMGWGDLYGEAA